jgi:hypothetical protein
MGGVEGREEDVAVSVDEVDDEVDDEVVVVVVVVDQNNVVSILTK